MLSFLQFEYSVEMFNIYSTASNQSFKLNKNSNDKIECVIFPNK